MNKEIENIIKKNLPEDRGTKNYTSSHEEIMNNDIDYGFNQALSRINTSLIADEVLKFMVEKIKEDLEIHSRKAVNTENKQDLDEEIGICKYIGKLLSNLSPNKENK